MPYPRAAYAGASRPSQHDIQQWEKFMAANMNRSTSQDGAAQQVVPYRESPHGGQTDTEDDDESIPDAPASRSRSSRSPGSFQKQQSTAQQHDPRYGFPPPHSTRPSTTLTLSNADFSIAGRSRAFFGVVNTSLAYEQVSQVNSGIVTDELCALTAGYLEGVMWGDMCRVVGVEECLAHQEAVLKGRAMEGTWREGRRQGVYEEWSDADEAQRQIQKDRRVGNGSGERKSPGKRRGKVGGKEPLGKRHPGSN